MSRIYSPFACLFVLALLSAAALGQQAPTPAVAPPVADPADAVTTSDQMIISTPPANIPTEQPAENGPTLAPAIAPPVQAETLPNEVVQPQVVETAPVQETMTITPQTFGELIRSNADTRRRLHDAQTQQERMLRDQHREVRNSLERQIRMQPAGSYARDRMVRQLRELRRQQERDEDYLDDYNDAQRRELLHLHQQQEATARRQLTVTSVVTVPHVHVGSLYSRPTVKVNVPQTVISPRPYYVPPAPTVRVQTRRGLFRRGGSVNVHVPRASVRVGW